MEILLSVCLVLNGFKTCDILSASLVRRVRVSRACQAEFIFEPMQAARPQNKESPSVAEPHSDRLI